jgi:3',5'-cyclic-AMP phosphodiesterase
MSFSFVHITDLHLTETETILRRGFSPAFALRSVLHHIAEHAAAQIDFIVSTGDLVEPATDAAYQNLLQMLNLKDVSGAPGPQRVTIEGLQDFPMYFLPGNHDDRGPFFRHLFPQTPPMRLMNAVFHHKGIQFICLDWGPQAKAVAYSETLNFLANALKSNIPSIVLMHHHILPVGSRWLDNFIMDGEEQFWELLKGYPVLGIFCGHVHLTYETQSRGIPVFGLRSTAFPFALQDEPLITLQPPQYRFVTVQDRIITTKVFEVQL